MEFALLLLGLLPLMFSHEEEQTVPDDPLPNGAGETQAPGCTGDTEQSDGQTILDIALQPVIEDDAFPGHMTPEIGLSPSQDEPDVPDFAEIGDGENPLLPVVEDDQAPNGIGAVDTSHPDCEGTDAEDEDEEGFVDSVYATRIRS